MRRLTQEEFIARSVTKHGYKYDYSKVVYVNNSEKVCIICKECEREFLQTPNQHMQGNGCPYCRGKHVWDKRGRITNEDFIRRAREIHGDKYEYDKVEYKNMKTKVLIYCKTCQKYFEQTPEHHLLQKSGCPVCEMASRAGRPLYKKRQLIKGVGILDMDFSQTYDFETRHTYEVWMDILFRCYSHRRSKKQMAYKDCYMCDEWKRFSNFKKWFDDNYVDGYAIDKDLICKGNKCYCPEYCCFVPQRINGILGTHRATRGKYPIGVSKTRSGNFSAKVGRIDGNLYLGTFCTMEAAFNAYKEAKEQYIKAVADEYYNKGIITKCVYDALYRWEIEITD